MVQGGESWHNILMQLCCHQLRSHRWDTGVDGKCGEVKRFKRGKSINTQTATFLWRSNFYIAFIKYHSELYSPTTTSSFWILTTLLAIPSGLFKYRRLFMHFSESLDISFQVFEIMPIIPRPLAIIPATILKPIIEDTMSNIQVTPNDNRYIIQHSLFTCVFIIALILNHITVSLFFVFFFCIRCARRSRGATGCNCKGFAASSNAETR